MSNVVFPSQANIPGLSWSVKQHPMFNTKVQRAVSGYESRTAYMQYPLWNITLSYDVLRDAKYLSGYTELQTMVDFFLNRQGMFDSFLYDNPNDNSATSMNIGTGNANNTTFQLSRKFGGSAGTFNEPVNNANVVTSITFNGVAQSAANYNISTTGLVTFSNATTRPGANVVVAWNGSYYYRCRFTLDEGGFDNFMRGLWELKELSFVGSVVNKV